MYIYIYIHIHTCLNELLIEALMKAVFCIFRPKYLLLILYFITMTVGVFLFALSFELYILIYIYIYIYTNLPHFPPIFLPVKKIRKEKKIVYKFTAFSGFFFSWIYIYEMFS